MAQKEKKISVQWRESKDLSKWCFMNIKHSICQLAEIMVEEEVVMRLNNHCCWAPK